MEEIACVIPARLGSKRFPSKPLAKIKGRELILRVVDASRQSAMISQTIVATEDELIRDLCESEGFESQLTDSHPSCTHRVAELAKTLNCDHVVNLQGDEPLVTAEMLDGIIRFHIDEGNRVTQAVFPLSEGEIDDPDCVKCVVNNGKVIFAMRKPEIATGNLFGLCGLYVYDDEALQSYLLNDLTLVTAWQGMDILGFVGAVDVKPYLLPYRPLPIDRPEDIAKVERCL